MESTIDHVIEAKDSTIWDKDRTIVNTIKAKDHTIENTIKAKDWAKDNAIEDII